MGDPLPGSGAEMAARIDQMTAAAKAKAERYGAMRALAGQVSVSESSKDGVVTVTVDSAGNLTDLRITDRVREMSGAEVAAAVLFTLRTAQSRLPDKLAAVMAETIGDDQQTADVIVNNYRAKFPEPADPDEDETRDEARDDGERLGEAAEPEEPAEPDTPPPAPKREPVAAADDTDDEDEGWDDESVLRS